MIRNDSELYLSLKDYKGWLLKTSSLIQYILYQLVDILDSVRMIYSSSYFLLNLMRKTITTMNPDFWNSRFHFSFRFVLFFSQFFSFHQKFILLIEWKQLKKKKQHLEDIHMMNLIIIVFYIFFELINRI